MGNTYAPSNANIFMVAFGEKYEHLYLKTTFTLYIRYMNDIFMISKVNSD